MKVYLAATAANVLRGKIQTWHCVEYHKWRSEVVGCHVISPVTLACHFLHFPHNFHEFKENVVSGWFVTWVSLTSTGG